MLYVMAAYTGLRASELASLAESSLNLTTGVPTAVVSAAYSKRRRNDVQPLRPDLADMISVWLVASCLCRASCGQGHGIATRPRCCATT